jgi:probable rRNA maturation factor
MKRDIAIRNAHPRLRVPAAQVRRAIALLDEHFQVLPGDLPYLVAPTFAVKRSVQSKIENLKSEIPPACPPGELSLVFLTDPGLAKLHADFMNDPTTTDVITFEGDPLAELAGEICVSADTAASFVGVPLAGRPKQTRRQAPVLQVAFATELTLYVVHGWLHLAGYDDLQPAKKRRMRAAEKRAMKLLAAHQAVPEFRYG